MSRVDPLANLSQFEPKASVERKPGQADDEIEKIATEHGFLSRQPAQATIPETRSQRRFKTGRNIQINIKGDQSTKDELYRLADKIDQPLGETLKRALAALDRELDSD